MHSILIIDDEPKNIEIIYTILNENNYDVLVATNGRDGFERAKQSQPTLIITDWEMPGLDGIETIKLLKAEMKTSHIPIIMATGKMTASTDLHIALAAGAMDYVRKPIDEIELLARVGSAILLVNEMQKNIQLEKEIAEKKRLELEDLLNQSKKELVNVSVKLVQSGKSIHEIINKLDNFIENDDDKYKSKITDLIKHIQTSALSLNWIEFETVFDKVHNNFHIQLVQAHRDLSKNEYNLCAFLRLNMSSKDISSITFQSVAAIEKARYRLRKKLNLEADDNLHLYLQQF